MSEWQRRQLTTGTRGFCYHAHSYYDIPVFDPTGRFVAAHRMDFAERPPTPADGISVGYVDCEQEQGFVTLGASHAWSWQQGPMAQWRASGRVLVWNDRQAGGFVTRLYDVDTGERRILPRPTYAVSPDDDFVLSLNMARLDTLRPGYGYPGGCGADLHDRAPASDGVWRMSFQNPDEATLVLSIDRAVRFMESQLDRKRRSLHKHKQFHYWFNHAKIAPCGRRFTVKLRFKRLDEGWDDSQGVSLTCGVDGQDLRLLAEQTSHVIWFNADTLYMWQRDGFYFYRDAAPRGMCLSQIGRGVVEANAHLRYVPGDVAAYVFDTPYRETVDLYLSDDAPGRPELLDRFTGHRPRNGPYRCDLHPCPSPDGRRLVVTSVEDGGRQIYLLERRDHDL